MKTKKKLVSYVQDGNLYYAVLNAKNEAVARFHRNELGLYTSKWWHVRIGCWELAVPPSREDVVVKSLVLFSDLHLADLETEKVLAGWRKTK